MPEPEPPAQRRPLLALSSTLAIQILASLAMSTASVLGPAVAPELGLAPDRIGAFMGTAYLAAMVSGLTAGPAVAAYGPIAASMMAMLAAAAGLSLSALGLPAVMLAGAILIGIGYGLTNPSAANVLQQHAPPQRSGLFFSIKQTGVPLGIALAGVLAPPLYHLFGWQSAALLLAAPAALLAVGLVRLRPVFDADAGRGPRRRVPNLLAPLAAVMREPRLRRLAMVSFVFALTQMSFLTFLVTYLTVERGMSLAVAASVLATAQLTSFAMRIGWGHVADRWMRPSVLLGWLGLGMGASVAGLALLPDGTSYLAALAVATLCAGTAVAWNGVYLAELVRGVPRDRVAEVSGASQFLTFFGATIGPVLFGQAVALSATYSMTYVGLAILPAATGISMLLAARGTPASAGGRS